MHKGLNDNMMRKIMLTVSALQLIIITLALIFATPVGAWVVAEFALSTTSPILHFMIGAIFFWVAGNIVSSVIGLILIMATYSIFWKDWRNI